MPPEGEVPTSIALALPWRSRAAAGLAGTAAVVFGVLAIFKDHDGAAAAVLLIIGAAFGLMAVTGYAITKIKAGDYEITLEVLQQAQRAYAEGDEERAEAIAASLIRQPATARAYAAAASPSLGAPGTGAAATDAYAYERQVLEVVVSVLPPNAQLQEQEAALSGVDAFIVFPEGTRIGLDVRAGTRFDLRVVADRMSAALTYARPELAGLIVIVRAGPDDHRAAQLRTLTAKLPAPVAVVAWDVGEPDDAIRDAIMDMIPRVR